jgi:hypothetical protein
LSGEWFEGELLFFDFFPPAGMPRIVTATDPNRLNPSIGRMRCFIRRGSCSTTLFKYLQDRTCTRRGKLPAAFFSAQSKLILLKNPGSSKSAMHK